MNETEMIAWINNASYYDLLYKWRFAKAGDPFFVGMVGEKYTQVMIQKRDALPPGKAAEISRQIGFEP